MNSLNYRKLGRIVFYTIVLIILGILGGLMVVSFIGKMQRDFEPAVSQVLQGVKNPSAQLEVYFSPTEDVQSKLISELQKAKETIDCSLYGITQEDIANTLIEKDKSGVRVRIGLDKMQAAGKSDKHNELIKGGVEVRIKKLSALEHNKYCVIDGRVATEGSYNFSKNARLQDNSFVIIRDKGIVDKFGKQFEYIWARDNPLIVTEWYIKRIK